jgi:chorismate mutase
VGTDLPARNRSWFTAGGVDTDLGRPLSAARVPPVAVRAVRGATQLEQDSRDHMLERVAEMVTQVMAANGWVVDDFISIIFTATTDLVSEFPAYAARMLGFTDVPLICTRELEIEGSMQRVVRMMAHVETDLPRADITHVYLHGAAALRRDLARVRTLPDEPPGA